MKKLQNQNHAWCYFVRAVVITIFLPVLSLQALALELTVPQKAYQGDLVYGKTDPHAIVSIAKRKIAISSNGDFVFGVPRSTKKDIRIFAYLHKKRKTRTVKILRYKWHIQRINGVARRYVEPDPKAVIKIRKDNQLVSQTRKKISDIDPAFIKTGFMMPVKGRVSGVFGSQRILNGKPRSPHKGVDIAAPKGAKVVCPADGQVALVAHDMYLMGNVLMIDHGLGVFSVFIHLNQVDVKPGDFVKQGDLIARVGKSGRATGPHLHWGVSVASVVVDPLRLIESH